MKKKPGWLFLAIFVGLLCVAGIQSFLENISTDLKGALRDLALVAAFAGITIFSFLKFLNRPAKPVPIPPPPPVRPKAASAQSPAPRFEVQFERARPDREIKTPDWAELSCLDAKALNFWVGRATDFKIPSYYMKDAVARNFAPALGRLLSGGYLRLSGIEQNVGLKTVPELKAVLSSKGLKTSGKKAELVQRILDNFSLQELQSLFPVGVYVATEKGRQELETYSIILDRPAMSLDISEFRLMDARAQNRYEKNEAIIERLVDEDIQNCYKTGDQGRFASIMPCAAEFFSTNGKSERALECAILSFFMWTRTLESLNIPDLHIERNYIATRVERYAQDCGLTFSEMVQKVRRTVEKTNPFGLGTKKNLDYAVAILKKALVLDQ